MFASAARARPADPSALESSGAAGERWTLLSAAVASLLGGMGLAGWTTPYLWLATLVPQSIPIAPSSALIVVLLGATLLRAACGRSPRGTKAGAMSAVLALVASGAQLALYLTGSAPVLDALLVPSPEPFGDYLTGRMSPLMALGLMLSSSSLLCVSLGLPMAGRVRRRRAMEHTGVLLGGVVTLLGSVVVLGYLFDAPLLYGSPVVPMSLSSAIALVCLGLAVLGLAPRDSALLRPFVGTSVRATLLRAFLPIVPAMIVFELVLARIEGLNRGLNAALAAIAAALLVAGIVAYVSHSTGLELDRSEAALRASEASFRELADAVPQMVWISRADGRIVYANRRWMDYTGQTLAESLGDGWSQAFHPKDRLRAEEVWSGATATGATVSMECRLRRADGIYRWWLVRGLPLRDVAGVVVKWYGSFTDIDEMIRAEQLVSDSEERFAKIFRSGLVAFSIAERKSGRMIDVNARWAALFGYQREEVLGRTVFELGLWDDSASREAFIAGLSTGGAQAHGEAAFRRKSGEVFYALAAVEVMTISGSPEPLLMTALIDLTERKRLEAQLLQAQKMEAVGRLAGGVAHDFNNALAVIQGYTEILLEGPIDDDQRSGLGEIQQAASRAGGLTRQLLVFSRKEVMDPRRIELNSLLANLEKMLKPLLGEDIELAIIPGANLGLVKADPGQLEQAVINLCVNARHAMPEGGQLRIETANVDASRFDAAAGAARHESVAPGRYVMLAVSDTGCGILEEVLPRIFEPFFTTKPAGVGTGLGLAMVYGSVSQAGGHVRVESQTGCGTTVRIYLPRLDGSADVLESREATEVAKGSATILLVEDEAAVRALVCKLLVDAGYRVLEAGGGHEALRLAAATVGEIPLLITDVVMPGMNGRELVQQLSAVRPRLRVIFVSGYTDDILANHGVLEPGTVLLAKPFTKAALLRTVHAALERPGAGATPPQPS